MASWFQVSSVKQSENRGDGGHTCSSRCSGPCSLLTGQSEAALTIKLQRRESSSVCLLERREIQLEVSLPRAGKQSLLRGGRLPAE